MIGYTCDICGPFKEREPCYTIRPREQYDLKQGARVTLCNPQFDICSGCWNDKVYPILLEVRPATVRYAGEEK